MLRKILFGIGFALLVFLAVAAFEPSEFHISRSATMKASSDKVFAQVNDLPAWEDWSPWAKLDPQAKNSYEGPASGQGASMSWIGNHEVGEGKMTIVESKPNEVVKFRLDFKKPFEATHNAEFLFKAEGDNTTVTWSMYGHNNFIGKAIGLIMNCDKMVGGQFEKGLESIKSIVEKG